MSLTGPRGVTGTVGRKLILNRCTVDVGGVDRIGISISMIKRLRLFGCRVLGYDPYISNGLARVPELASLLAECDMVILHYTLPEESREMIKPGLLVLSQIGLVLINAEQGNRIQGLGMIEDGLKSGQLTWVGLDVMPR